MLTKSRIPLLVTAVIILEIAIYLWAAWTSRMDKSNFFAIEPEFIFDKCARNSGRVSSFLNLGILLMIGYYGFRNIYADEKKKDAFRILVTLFTVNHLAHFFFVYQNFSHHSMELSLLENLHGFITFICILIFPVILWLFESRSTLFYSAIAIHLFNVSYFIMKTFYSKVQPDKPAYHNQLGILMTTAACVYVVYRFVRDYKLNVAVSDTPTN